MKVYEIATGYTPIPAARGAATEIVVENLTWALRAQGVDAEILDIRSHRRECDLPIREVPVPRWLGDTDTALGLRHKLRRVAYSVCLARELKALLKTSETDTVLHFHNQYNLFFSLLLVPRRLRKKAFLAYTNHTGLWRLPWEEIRSTVAKRYFQEAMAMKAADVVFVLNEETKENLIRHLSIPEARIKVVRNGVDTLRFHPLSPEEREKEKARRGLAGKTVILQAGSVCENKGQVRTLKALAPMLKGQDNLVFAYVGAVVEGDYQNTIEDTARHLGLEAQVRYLGAAGPEEMNRLYGLAHITVLSSKYEGFPLVTAESLAAGVPAATPFPIGPGCAETVAEALRNRDDLAEAGLAFARECLTWERVAEDHMKIWEEALCQRNSTAR